MGIFSSDFLNYHRSSFQEFVRQSRETEKLIFSKTDFQLIHWEEADKEFQWEGKMYDVSRIEKDSEVITIYCTHDEFEDAILNFFKLKGPQTDMPVAKGRIQPLYFQGLIHYKVLSCIRQEYGQPFDDNWLDPLHQEIPSPPPRLIRNY